MVDKSHQDSSPLGAGVTVILSPVLKRCWKRFSRKGCTTFKRRKTDRSKIQVAFFLALAVRKTHGMTDRIIAEDFQASVGHVQEYSARVPLKHEAREETKEHRQLTPED